MKYDFELEMDSDNSLSMILRTIEKNSTVLEFGPAMGRMTKYLKEALSCHVVIIEYDRDGYESAIRYAEDGFCGNAEMLEWKTLFSAMKFDYIIFADVLEHLRNPQIVLEAAVSLLAENGQIVMSVPNLAHNSVMINLFHGKFEYQDVGLLDNTHIHFFTYSSLKEMIDACELETVCEDATYLECEKTEFSNSLMELPSEMRYAMEQRDYAYVYQFIFWCRKKADILNSKALSDEVYRIEKRHRDNLTVFVDYGEGYLEEDCICREVHIGNNAFRFSFEHPERIRKIRIDFIETSCFVHLSKLSINDKELGNESFRTNCSWFENKDYEFITSDPCVEFQTKGFEGELELQFDLQILTPALLENLAERKRNALIRVKKDCDEIKRDCDEIKKYYDDIKNSTCWRMTKPLRVFMNTFDVKRIRDLLCKGVKSLFKDGVRATLRKVRYRFESRKQQFPLMAVSEMFSLDEFLPIRNLSKKIAVHVHLYYDDLLDEFVDYFKNIPYPFDLFVSCREEADANEIKEHFLQIENVGKVTVKAFGNKGRDIAPLYVGFAKEIQKYDYFLHVHSKKSLYTGNERSGWRRFSMDHLCGSKDLVRKIFSMFEDNDKKVGIVFPETHSDVPFFGHAWLSNEMWGRELLNRMGIPFEDGLFNYPVGSFFWAKTEAVQRIFDLSLTLEDFPEEKGQNDGTIAHALERVLAFVTKASGYNLGIIDLADNVVRFNRSIKPFKEYFGFEKTNVTKILSDFNTISFDIFDTLITRLVYEPDDVFRLIEFKIEEKYGKKYPYVRMRKESEREVWEREGASTDIDKIYDCLQSKYDISYEMAQEWKQLEVDTECEVCIPRKDMLEVYNELHKLGKKIVLVSDMYLTSEYLTRLLNKCGYSGWDDMWISCERNCRKDSGTLWAQFYSFYDAKTTVHVGDNMHSDYQNVCDLGYPAFGILNGRHIFQLSEYYEYLKPYIGTTLGNSLMLGMFVNGGVFNSPFCFDLFGGIRISTIKDVGFSVFGPVFALFTKWILKEGNGYTKLFLSREGWLLQQLFNDAASSCHMPVEDGVYFLTSRRAIATAAIQNEKGIRELLAQYYDGGITNLLESRLGYSYTGKEILVKMPEDIDKVMSLLKPDIKEILLNCQSERETYMKYIDSITQINTSKPVMIIDVGYSGTIQYYYSLLTGTKPDGNYLVTFRTKPDRIGCKCQGIYEIKTHQDETDNHLFRYQLFLEAATKAPYGQLIKIEQKEGKLLPVYNSDVELSDEIKELQEGIREFNHTFFELTSSAFEKFECDKELVDLLFGLPIEKGAMSGIGGAIFKVSDEYCTNGTQIYNFKMKKWEIE